MTDVFIRVYSFTELRLGFAISTVARWKMQKDANVTVLRWARGIPYDFGCRTVEVFDTRKLYDTISLEEAERRASSSPYVICNDDSLPYGQDFIKKGLELLENHPSYGIISGMAVNESGYIDTGELTEAHSVGGLVFLRKGLVTEFPNIEDRFWDGERHKQIVSKGFTSGHARSLPYLHIGSHFSIASPAYFDGA